MTETPTSDGAASTAALASFQKAQRAAEAAISQCEALATTSEDLRTTARQMAEILTSCADALTAVQFAETDLRTRLDSSLESLGATQQALQRLEADTAGFEARVIADVSAAIDREMASTATRMEDVARASVDSGVDQLRATIDAYRAELSTAQQNLARQLEVAVATVHGQLTPNVPPRLRWAGVGQLVAVVGAVVVGIGWLILQIRAGDPYSFDQDDERVAALWTALGAVGVGLLSVGLSVVGLLRRERRWWLSVLALAVAIASVALAGHVAVSIGVDSTL